MIYLFFMPMSHALSLCLLLLLLLLQQPSAREFPERSDVLACHPGLGHGRYILLNQSTAGNKQSPSLVSETVLPCSIRCRKEISPFLYTVRELEIGWPSITLPIVYPVGETLLNCGFARAFTFKSGLSPLSRTRVFVFFAD